MKQIVLAPPIFEEDYGTVYDFRRKASSMTSLSVKWLCEKVPEMLKQAENDCNGTFKVLSVGAGPGDIDVPFFETLQRNSVDSMNSKWNQVQFLALEPNRAYRERLRKRLAVAQLDTSVGTISVQKDCFEAFDDTDHSFNVVILAHVLYYFENIALALHVHRISLALQETFLCFKCLRQMLQMLYVRLSNHS